MSDPDGLPRETLSPLAARVEIDPAANKETEGEEVHPRQRGTRASPKQSSHTTRREQRYHGEDLADMLCSVRSRHSSTDSPVCRWRQRARTTRL